MGTNIPSYALLRYRSPTNLQILIVFILSQYSELEVSWNGGYPSSIIHRLGFSHNHPANWGILRWKPTMHRQGLHPSWCGGATTGDGDCSPQCWWLDWLMKNWVVVMVDGWWPACVRLFFYVFSCLFRVFGPCGFVGIWSFSPNWINHSSRKHQILIVRGLLWYQICRQHSSL